MKFSILLFSLVPCTLAYQGEFCGNSNTPTGTCELTSWCSANGGTHNVPNLCPDDPPDVTCCFNPNCDNDTGYCMDTSAPNASFDCHHQGGVFRSGYCPGPDNYQCCASVNDT